MMATIRNDPFDAETERVSRELCESLSLDADEIVAGEARWRSEAMVEMALGAIASWRVLSGRRPEIK